MNVLVLDFETYFDSDYTPKKLTTEAYIRDPRFAVHLLGVFNPITDERFCLHTDHEIRQWAHNVDWSITRVIAHHAQFDGLILNHHYGIRPARWMDTLSMARLMIGNHVSVALGSLAKHYGLPDKSVPYNEFMGVRPENLPASTRTLLAEGCLHDCELTWEIIKRLLVGFPEEEFEVIDITVRMFTEPRLVGDAAAFRRLQTEEWTHKNDLMLKLGVTEKQLQSSGEFVELLRQRGIEPEFKNGKNGPIPAVAKTDNFMKELLEDDDEVVAGLAQARLDVRSTIDETRAGRLAGMAERGGMPVYLSYCGAHTTRWSGGDKVNFQNLPRGGELRKALRAPRGQKLVIVDLSQIECRILNCVAGQENIVEAFREKRDLYCEGASEYYGRTITKADKEERFNFKTIELGCGYGLGAPKLAAKLGIEQPIAQTMIDAYRRRHDGVVRYWKTCDRLLAAIAGTDQVKRLGPLEIRTGRVELPGGPPMLYQLEYDQDIRSWKRRTRSGWRRIWGGGLTENFVQYMARLVMSRAMVKIAREGIPIVLTTHDELVCLAMDAWAEQALRWIIEQMTAPVDWLPGIPLDAEGAIDDVYSK